MVINKKTSNGGKMDNPGGVSKLDCRAQIAQANNELVSNYKGHVSICRCCGESFRVNAEDYSLEESSILDDWLSNNGCPYCDWKNPKIIKIRKQLVEHNFNIGGMDYKCLRVPVGYRYRKILSFDAETQSVPTSKVSKGIKIYSYDSRGKIIDLK